MIPFFWDKQGNWKTVIFQKSKGEWWQFLSGGGEDNENLYETVLREIEEEISVSYIDKLYLLDTINSIPVAAFSKEQRAGWKNDILVIPENVFAVEIDPEDINLSTEHLQYRIVNYDEAIVKLRWDSNKTALWELKTLIEQGELSSKLYDRIIATDKWNFDENVAACFKNMLERSIPEYHMMRKLVLKFGLQFLRRGDTIVDIGCSCGGALLPFVRNSGHMFSYIGIEKSIPMLEQCYKVFAKEIEDGYARFIHSDILNDGITEDANVFLCILTLQFIPKFKRQELLNQIYAKTKEKGILILVEKINGVNEEQNRLFSDIYYSIKHEQGYSYQQIENKRKSLIGILDPCTKVENEKLLINAGFYDVFDFWQCGNFCGWIAKK